MDEYHCQHYGCVWEPHGDGDGEGELGAQMGLVGKRPAVLCKLAPVLLELPLVGQTEYDWLAAGGWDAQAWSVSIAE